VTAFQMEAAKRRARKRVRCGSLAKMAMRMTSLR
jgi:hypothetical protein